MRIVLWHGWLLEGSGSNIHTARVAEAWRRAGHDVLLLSQERDPSRHPFIDAAGTVNGDRVGPVAETGHRPGLGRVVALRPEIGDLLPVFVYDEYPGFRVRRFVDLEDQELAGYLERNVAALHAAVRWHGAEAVVVGHAVPGATLARRALGEGGYVAKVHGSDLEYAVRPQERYLRMAREGLEGSRAVTGASRDVLARVVDLVPAVAGRIHVIPPGVDVERWRPQPRAQALERAAALLERDPDAPRGRPGWADARVREILAAREPEGLDALASAYDQAAPDPDAAGRLRALARHRGPVVAYLGKLIPQKGVERLLEALALRPPDVHGLVIGFGTFREWLAALVAALDSGDPDAAAWVGAASPARLELAAEEVRRAAGLGSRVTFTGRLDHRYAPLAVSAADVLVVPSTLEEAFGMVAAEGAAAGALPLVSRHSALAEVAAALEGAIGRPGLLSFEPGAGATRRLAEALRVLLSLPEAERRQMGAAVHTHVASEWTWERTAERLLQAAVA